MQPKVESYTNRRTVSDPHEDGHPHHSEVAVSLRIRIPTSIRLGQLLPPSVVIVIVIIVVVIVRILCQKWRVIHSSTKKFSYFSSMGWPRDCERS